MIRTSTLDNGLQVVTESMRDVQSVALSFWVGTGSRDESDEQAGMSHFLEHLLFKGSEKRDALDIAQTIDAIGGDMNAFTTKECTSFYLRALADDMPTALDVLCDIMCDPRFDPDEVEAERQVILEEILMRNDEPADLVYEHWAATIWSGHQLGRDILGAEEHIASMKTADIRTFFEHHYRPHNLVFAAAGALDHDALVESVNQHWRSRDGGARPERSAPSASVGQRKTFKRNTDQAHVVIGIPAPNRHHHDRYAMSLLDLILGGGMSSCLFQEVREKRGLAYTVFSSYSAYDDAGELSMYAGTAPNQINEVTEVIQAEAEHVASDGVTEQELARAKQNMRATTLMNLEDTSARMSRIGRSLLLHGDVLSVEEVQRRLEAVTVDDLKRVSADLLVTAPVIVALGPQGR